VVIADGRIVAAGVFLPISLSKELSRAWGTRHRAAIGLSEETDGLCLVVSEERGTVTLVSRGEVTPIADTNDLRQRLVEKLGEEAPPRTSSPVDDLSPATSPGPAPIQGVGTTASSPVSGAALAPSAGGNTPDTGVGGTGARA
jgi:hypothetical protein